MIDPTTDRVLITGAAGAVGTALRSGLRDRWRHLRLTDIRPVRDLAANEELVVADIADRPALEGMMRGVRAVVHLAGIVGTYTLEDLFRVNARGLFDVFGSARLAGVERIVFTSSNHAFGFYPIAEKVSPALPPRPDSLYGVFKVWGVRVGLLSVGDELRASGEHLEPGQIHDVNGPMLQALLLEPVVELVDFGLQRDDRDGLASLVREAAKRVDILISSGGVSGSDADHVAAAIGDVGGAARTFKLALKPRKPLLAGRIGLTPVRLLVVAGPQVNASDHGSTPAAT